MRAIKELNNKIKSLEKDMATMLNGPEYKETLKRYNEKVKKRKKIKKLIDNIIISSKRHIRYVAWENLGQVVQAKDTGLRTAKKVLVFTNEQIFVSIWCYQDVRYVMEVEKKVGNHWERKATGSFKKFENAKKETIERIANSI